jgi:ClpP class serine protease
MDVSGALWFVFLLMALHPAIRQKLLEASRKRALATLERERNSRVILLIHRQETMSLLGFPVMRYIDIDDSEEVLRAIQMTDPDVPVDLVLHTPGGLVVASLQIARALKQHRARVTVFVPHYAMSGGTLIALAADEIVMSPYAILGPVDPQLGKYPAVSILQAVQNKPVERLDDETLILADQARKAIAQVHHDVKELLMDRMGEAKAEEVARQLSGGQWTHDRPITAAEAGELGLPVTTAMPDSILRLMSLYPQPVKRQPTVEYLPLPRRTGEHRATGT